MSTSIICLSTWAARLKSSFSARVKSASVAMPVLACEAAARIFRRAAGSLRVELQKKSVPVQQSLIVCMLECSLPQKNFWLLIFLTTLLKFF